MKRSSKENEDITEQSGATAAVLEPSAASETPLEAPATDHSVRLQAVQDKVAQYLREKRYTDAQRALKEAEQIQAEESKTLWLAEAKAEREKALLLTTEGKLAETKQALERADELECKAAGRMGRPKQLVAALRSRLPHASEPAGLSASEPVTESLRIVSFHSKLAAAVGWLPGGLNFVAVLAVQVPMVWRIARAFDQKVGKEQVRGVLVSLFGSIIPGIVGHGASMAIASIPAVMAGTVVYFVATPILAYALTRAVGNVFIMHFESGGTLLTFDPEAFKDSFVNEFKKAGGTVRPADEPAPAAKAASA